MTHVTVRPAAALVAALGALALAGAAGAAETTLKTTLAGPAEKPVPGDPKASGSATVTLDTAKAQVCYTVEVKGIAPATAAHIHKAPPSQAGPPAVTLKTPDAAGKSSGCAPADAALLKDLGDNPGAYYVNVHNAAFKAGAARGQLSK
jgi:hypothetical protein